MEDDKTAGLPASIASAWGVRERPRRGPKRGLSLNRIVDAGVHLAQTGGIEAVSMSRVAAEIGASTMSLYRYIASKDELLVLMQDTVAGEAPIARGPEDTWRTGLERWAWGQIRAIRQNPWTLRIPISGPPITPNSVTWMEQGLRCLRDTTLDEGEKFGIILLINGHVRQSVLLEGELEAAFSAAGTTESEVLQTWQDAVTTLIDADRYPALNAAFSAGIATDPGDADTDFTFGLDRILDGVEALIERRSGDNSI